MSSTPYRLSVDVLSDCYLETRQKTSMPALGSDNLGNRDPKPWATFGPCLGYGSTRNDPKEREMSRNAESSAIARFSWSHKSIRAFDLVRMGLRG